MNSDEHFIPPHGGFEKLHSFQKSLIVFDATLHFCGKFLPKRGDRTVDQMVQAARSGKQNIVEGSDVSGVSKEGELKLTGVARASLKELAQDYLDFLRNHASDEWEPSHPYAKRLRQLNRTPGANYATFKKGIEHPDPLIAANVILGLIRVTCYLLDRQIARLERDFLKNGGLRERMTQARLRERERQRREQKLKDIEEEREKFRRKRPPRKEG